MDAASIGTVAAFMAIGFCALAVLRPRMGVAALTAAAVASAVATAALVWALVSLDFSISYVADTTTRATPWPYRLAATWGSLDGSLMFFSTLLAFFAALGVWTIQRRLPRLVAPYVVAAALVVGGFHLLGMSLISPFTKLLIPAIDGSGLVAILEHPAMVYHPPILYAGLTSLLVPFSLAIGGLARRSLDAGWLRLTRSWILVSWTLLAAGMLAGANWAYVELGWGGFWAWDPIENSSLAPWLVATSFLHTSRIQQRTGRLSRWNAATALAPFLLVLGGAYITRSGVTGSVHAFGESPTLGRVLLGFVAVGVIGALVGLARSDRSEGWRLDGWHGRETWLALNTVLLLWAAFVVTIGTATPAIVSAIGNDGAIVGARFYTVGLAPAAAVAIVAMALAFRTRWRDADGRRSPWTVGRVVGPLAHAGMIVVILAATASTLGASHRGAFAVGDSVEVGSYVVRLDHITVGKGDRFSFVKAEVALLQGDDVEQRLFPEMRAYEGRFLPTPEPSLHTTLLSDVVVGISRVSDDATLLQLDVFVRPLVLWVWAGALLVVAAGLLGLVATIAPGASRRRSGTTEQPPAKTTTDRSTH